MTSKLTIGILSNPDFQTSVLASVYIQRVLEKVSMRVILITLEDLIRGNIHADLVFNVYYGEIGDGSIAASLLEKQGIPYVGNSPYSCSLMLNKVVAKIKFQQSGFTTPLFWYRSNLTMSAGSLIDDITNTISYPLLAKPVNGASGTGITFIGSGPELTQFIEAHLSLVRAGYYFFEEFIAGREVTTGYVNSFSALPVMELRLLADAKSNTFFPSHKEKILPANVPADIYKKIQHAALQLHTLFCCDTFSRTDMVYDEIKDRLYILEINTNPALIGHAFFLQLIKASGVEEEDFFKQLITYSLEKRTL